MPTLSNGAGTGLSPGAVRVDGPGPHLAQTGHTIQTHNPHRGGRGQVHGEHVFTNAATCDGCGVHIDDLMDGEVVTMLAM